MQMEFLKSQYKNKQGFVEMVTIIKGPTFSNQKTSGSNVLYNVVLKILFLYCDSGNFGFSIKGENIEYEFAGGGY